MERKSTNDYCAWSPSIRVYEPSYYDYNSIRVISGSLSVINIGREARFDLADNSAYRANYIIHRMIENSTKKEDL